MIKFRAWDPLNKIMITSFYRSYAHTERGRFSYGLRTVNDNEIKAMAYVNSLESLIYEHSHDLILMQYTGLYDLNGKQYCQDDLVKWNGNIYRLIHGTYAFELYGFYYQMQDDPWDYFSEGAYLEGEIIGNIYANPELLSSGIE